MARIKRETSRDGVWYNPHTNSVYILSNSYLEQFINRNTRELFRAYTATLESLTIPKTPSVLIEREDESSGLVYLGKL